MNTTKKIAVVLAVMMVAAAMAAPAAMGIEVRATPNPTSSDDAAYSATVHTGQSTSVAVTSAAFGDILRGSTHTISPSFNLTNNGDWDASVDAKFTDSSSGVHGMTNATEALVIPAASFFLTVTGGSETVMLNSGVDAEICSELDHGAAAKDVAAKLVVPDNQAADTYTGTIRLTFSNTASY